MSTAPALGKQRSPLCEADRMARSRAGIQLARALGFRVRLAATVSSDDEAEEFRQFLDAEKVAEEDRVIRRIALRGAASEGVAVTRTDLVPEVTITAEGVYWHPVGAEDNDLLVTRRRPQSIRTRTRTRK